jgi:23S rRNA (adenine2503-C2)-methyltransferase
MLTPKTESSGSECSDVRPSIISWQALDQCFRLQRWDPYHLKRFRHALFIEGRGDEDSLAVLPPEIRSTVIAKFKLHVLSPPQLFASQDDASEKAIFCPVGSPSAPFETVLLRGKGSRRTLCVSCQVGCAAGCKFCATAKLGLRRQLSAAEILDQVVFFRQRLRDSNERLRNIVFMGMGEPFHNESALYEALSLLQDPLAFAFSPRRLMVSTVGVPEAMLRFASSFPQIAVALSLHSAKQELRSQLIPLADRTSLGELRAVLEVLVVGGRPVMIEYLMLNQVNDSTKDAEQLARFLGGLNVHVNLIPFNPIEDSKWISSPKEVRDQFAMILRNAGFVTTIRYSQGQDIDAACGQLAGSGGICH